MSVPVMRPDLLASTAPLRLAGICCTQGHKSLPAQHHGCEWCGAAAENLASIAIDPVGSVQSAVTVHVHAEDYPKAPFVLATIVLDDGPSTYALIDCDPHSPPAIGERVVGMLVDVSGPDGQTVKDIRFRPEAH